jgi:methionyl-tRNA synthetase
VQHFWSKLKDRGYIKEGKHQGYYSVNEESFIPEKDLIKVGDNYTTESGEKVELIEEKNYVFEIT